MRQKVYIIIAMYYDILRLLKNSLLRPANFVKLTSLRAELGWLKIYFTLIRFGKALCSCEARENPRGKEAKVDNRKRQRTEGEIIQRPKTWIPASAGMARDGSCHFYL
jgi:hypothetical protein